MKKKSGFAWKVGLFVSTGFAIFIIAVYYIGKQKNLFGSTIRLKTVFSTVSGLQVGNNVRFSGINVGTVDNIRLISDTSVQVEMIIQSKVQQFIKKDARATIGSEGLMGDKLIVITAGSAENSPVNDYAMLASDNPVETDAIFASLKVTAENAEIITDQLAEITFKINNGNGAISKLLMDTTIADNLARTMANLSKSSKNLNQNMEAAKESILLRGAFKRKERQKEKAKEEIEEKKKEEEKK